MRRSWSLIAGLPCVLALSATLSISVPEADAQPNPFLGEIRWVAFNYAPPGWAFCDGRLLSISNNQALFALLGTTFGGNGTTDFALPDLQGRVQIGQGSGPGLTPRQMGDQGGEEAVSLTVDQMPAHSHQALASSYTATSDAPAGRVLANVSANGPDPKIYSSGTANVALGSSAIGETGGGKPQDNMPPFVTLNCIIAVNGIFPPRQ
jgi:microcystin-dependent protein